MPCETMAPKASYPTFGDPQSHSLVAVTFTSVLLPPKDNNTRSMNRNTNTGVCSLGPALSLTQTLGHLHDVT